MKAVRGGFWRFLLIGWGLFWLIGVAGVFPFANRGELIANRTLTTIFLTGATILLWHLCARLMDREWSWKWRITVVMIVSFFLGYASVVAAWDIDRRFPFHDRTARLNFKGELRGALYALANNVYPLLAWAALFFAMRYWQESSEQQRRRLQAETLARDAELRALRSELTPHFLFNTLNGISTLVGEERVPEARRMIARLGDFLRLTLNDLGLREVPLEQEMERAKEYLAIEQVRLGDRLKLTFDIDDDVRDVPLPTLLLQPLVENAICHGIARNPEPGEIRIGASRIRDRVRIILANSLQPDRQSATQNMGLGLKNTRERLSAHYGGAYRLEAGERESSLWEVIVEFPMKA